MEASRSLWLCTLTTLMAFKWDFICEKCLGWKVFLFLLISYLGRRKLYCHFNAAPAACNQNKLQV